MGGSHTQQLHTEGLLVDLRPALFNNDIWFCRTSSSMPSSNSQMEDIDVRVDRLKALVLGLGDR